MKYQHLFFDLDHTLWDFDTNAKLTLIQLFEELELKKAGVHDFELFYTSYLLHNDKLWARYRSGAIRAEELRWKRMLYTLLEFKIGDEKLAKLLGDRFLELLPNRNILFPGTIDTLTYLHNKGYNMHLITNGFEETQHNKLRNSGISTFFIEVITSERSNSIKPKKEIFDFALNLAKATHAESIMIGDSIEVDIQGAQNAGIDQVHMNHTNKETTLLPTFTARSLKDLENIF
ncbi:MAG: YjjG family noncanonical pyrimidine nucleotidase [Flavitalea sp.]